MANKNLTQLTAATTPLAGTEILAIVQSGTKKVSIADLTAGRDVSVLGLTLTGLTASYGVITDGAKKLSSVAMTGSGSLVRDTSPTLNGNWTYNTAYAFGGLNYSFKIQYSTASGGYIGQSIVSGGLSMMQGGYYRGGGPHITDANSTSFAAVSVVGGDTIIYGNTGLAVSTTFTATPRITVAGATGNATLHTGNLVQGTAAKGVNFTANTPAAGMTSQLLNWYEEGTWTPVVTAFSGTITTVGAVSGRFTRIGRQLFLSADCVITTNGTGAVLVKISGMPYSASGSRRFSGCGYESNVSGKGLAVDYVASSSYLGVIFYDGTYPGANNARLLVSITYDI